MAIVNATAYIIIAKYSCKVLTNIWKSMLSCPQFDQFF